MTTAGLPTSMTDIRNNLPLQLPTNMNVAPTRPSSISISQKGYDSFGERHQETDTGLSIRRSLQNEQVEKEKLKEEEDEAAYQTENLQQQHRKEVQQKLSSWKTKSRDTSPQFVPLHFWDRFQWFIYFPPLLGEDGEECPDPEKEHVMHPWKQIGATSHCPRTVNEFRAERVSFFRRCLAELIGTFILTFSHACLKVRVTEKHFDPTGAALASGLTVSAIIYAFGPICGAHVNPAVTFSFFLRRAFPGRWVIPYWLSQFIGALIAASMVRSFFDTQTEAHLGSTYPDGGFQTETIFWCEALCSSIFFTTILGVSKKGGVSGTNAGLAVGFTLFWILMFRTEIGGGSLNPFRSLSMAIVNGPLNVVWPYIVGPFLASFIAAGIVWLQYGNVSLEELQKAQGKGEEG